MIAFLRVFAPGANRALIFQARIDQNDASRLPAIRYGGDSEIPKGFREIHYLDTKHAEALPTVNGHTKYHWRGLTADEQSCLMAPGGSETTVSDPRQIELPEPSSIEGVIGDDPEVSSDVLTLWDEIKWSAIIQKRKDGHFFDSKKCMIFAVPMGSATPEGTEYHAISRELYDELREGEVAVVATPTRNIDCDMTKFEAFIAPENKLRGAERKLVQEYMRAWYDTPVGSVTETLAVDELDDIL